MNTNAKKKSSILQSNLFIMLLVLVGVIVMYTILNKNFISGVNISNILLASASVGLFAIGSAYLIIAGQIDLSCASQAAVTAMITAKMINAGLNPVIVLILVVLISTGYGLISCVLVNVFQMQPFIATLAMKNVYTGAAYLLGDGVSIAVSNQSFNALATVRFLGIPLQAVIMIIFFVVFGFILAKTVFGRSIYMVGGNREAARLAGLNPVKITNLLYLLMSWISAVAGYLICAKMHSGQPTAGTGAEFDGITAAILGGVAFTGGTGNLLGVFIGLMVMQCFNNGLQLVGVSAFWQMVAKGLLLIIALIIDFFRIRNLQKQG